MQSVRAVALCARADSLPLLLCPALPHARPHTSSELANPHASPSKEKPDTYAKLKAHVVTSKAVHVETSSQTSAEFAGIITLKCLHAVVIL
eukprot:3042437-Pyramimonas_sp.AAC.1